MPRGGVIRDESVRRRVLDEFLAWAHEQRWDVRGTMESPIAGGEGNIEYLVLLSSPVEAEEC